MCRSEPRPDGGTRPGDEPDGPTAGFGALRTDRPAAAYDLVGEG